MPDRATQIHTAGTHRPSVRERGRMRRRLREQRRMREALLLDLGALVLELQRQGRREPELLQAKAAELSAVDNEVRALAKALDAGHTVLELVATGVAGSCGGCGSLLSTDARYCSACGAPAVPSLQSDRRAGDGAALGFDRDHEQDTGRVPGLPAPGRFGRIRERARRRDPDG
ncbi:MAG: zinc ribbon domain-containing protein [Thermoleophilaceae bacterium]|nr:zinc ribbon domain-containing protein [Thermoleophilaceae bacterium]